MCLQPCYVLYPRRTVMGVKKCHETKLYDKKLGFYVLYISV